MSQDRRRPADIAWDRSYKDAASDQLVRGAVGRELATHYELPNELPDQLLGLLRRMDDQQR